MRKLSIQELFFRLDSLDKNKITKKGKETVGEADNSGHDGKDMVENNSLFSSLQ